MRAEPFECGPVQGLAIFRMGDADQQLRPFLQGFAEQIHGPRHWSLDTILQEPGNLHLYEKKGYRRTGQIERINDRMDIVFYEKD